MRRLLRTTGQQDKGHSKDKWTNKKNYKGEKQQMGKTTKGKKTKGENDRGEKEQMPNGKKDKG